MGKTGQTDAPAPSRKTGPSKAKAKGTPRKARNNSRAARRARNAAKQPDSKQAHTLKRNGPRAAAAVWEFYLRRKAGMDDHTRLEFPREVASVRAGKAANAQRTRDARNQSPQVTGGEHVDTV